MGNRWELEPHWHTWFDYGLYQRVPKMLTPKYIYGRHRVKALSSHHVRDFETWWLDNSLTRHWMWVTSNGYFCTQIISWTMHIHTLFIHSVSKLHIVWRVIRHCILTLKSWKEGSMYDKIRVSKGNQIEGWWDVNVNDEVICTSRTYIICDCRRLESLWECLYPNEWHYANGIHERAPKINA